MRKQHNFKLPEWAEKRLKAIAEAYETTMTDALLRCIDQGSKWHRRHIQNEIKSDFDFTVKTSKPGVVLEDTTTNQVIMTSDPTYTEDMERTINAAKKKWIDDN